MEEPRDGAVVVVERPRPEQELEVPEAEEVARALEVPLDELAAACAVLVAGVLEEAVEARRDARLDALEFVYELGQGAPDSKRVAVSEGNAVLAIEWDEPYVVVEVALGVRHKEERGPRVEGEAVRHQPAYPAAEPGVLLEDLHLEALCGEPDRRRQGTHSCAYYRYPFSSRRFQNARLPSEGILSIRRRSRCRC